MSGLVSGPKPKQVRNPYLVGDVAFDGSKEAPGKMGWTERNYTTKGYRQYKPETGADRVVGDEERNRLKIPSWLENPNISRDDKIKIQKNILYHNPWIRPWI
jgi:hypothetical protein